MEYMQLLVKGLEHSYLKEIDESEPLSDLQASSEEETKICTVYMP